jgi:putative SOS response-associated peptidase YedK
MTGRFALDAPYEKIKAQFAVEEFAELRPRFNITPGQNILFLSQFDEDHSNHLLYLRWGLVPFWAKDKKIGNSLSIARSETVAEKPAFRQSFKSKRGIIIMSGFFEWKQEPTKQPYYFKYQNNELLAVAALWDRWQSEEGEIVDSCCLLTADANKLMIPIHHRMPVLLNKDELSTWMDNTQCDKPELLKLLKPYAKDDLECYPVTTKMNNSRFNQHQAIEPLS